MNSFNDVKGTLKKATELPQKRLSKAVKTAMKVPLAKAKEILKNVPDDYIMSFDDGNTWTKDDIIKNLYLELEKGGGSAKKVCRLGIRDKRVDNYSNFVEFGYHDNQDYYKYHEPTHFMRRSLDETAGTVSEKIITELLKSLEELGVME